MGIFLVVVSGAVSALFSLGYKIRGLKPQETATLLAYMAVAASLLSLCGMALFAQWKLPLDAVLTGAPQGIANFAAVYLFFVVARRVRLNISWTIIQFYVVVPFFVSLFVFRDPFTLRGAAGVAMILGSILLFGRKGGGGANSGERIEGKLLVMLLLSTLFSGIASALSKVYAAVDIAHPPFPMVLAGNLAFFILAAASVAVPLLGGNGRGGGAADPVAERVAAGSAARRGAPESAGTQNIVSAPPRRVAEGGFHLSRVGLAVAGWMGLTQLVNTALLIVGLGSVAGTIAFPIRIVVNITGVVFLSRLLFSERLSRPEWAGTVVAIAGVALVASSA